MTRQQFESLLREATRLAIEFARTFVLEELSDDTTYRLYPNQSHDENSLVRDEKIFPEDSLPNIHDYHVMSGDQVVEFLWREGKVPEWIDIAVAGLEDSKTVLSLTCCGRFAADPMCYYYDAEDGTRSPFGVKSPNLPPNYDSSADPPQKFHLPR